MVGTLDRVFERLRANHLESIGATAFKNIGNAPAAARRRARRPPSRNSGVVRCPRPQPTPANWADYSSTHLKPSISGTHLRSTAPGRLVIEATKPIHDRTNAP
jgi:hypothetical protein